ncbi:LuxR family transcriptional regulator [Pseudonocardia sp. AL041005-10]|nr:response regulator transcription factor [Pseudonocardia sp. AL041005-10]ALE80213.1 LuxR family transcriptional regulator [Pseudonocardia sp. AL041005-10]
MTDVTVVVVDDHPTFRMGVRAVLAAGAGVAVVGEGESGEQALERVAETDPDVVLMDLTMPGIGGLEATRRLVAAGSRPAVVVLSMSGSDDSVFAALRSGARGYLLKEAPPEEILTAVRAAAAGQGFFGAGVAGRISAFFASAATSSVRPFPDLSDREREVLALLADGVGNAAIAHRLALSPKTVRNHVSNVLAKLRAADRAEAGARAREAGLGRDRPG